MSIYHMALEVHDRQITEALDKMKAALIQPPWCYHTSSPDLGLAYRFDHTRGEHILYLWVPMMDLTAREP